MKERPILMATESVKAILDVQNTQTRRVIKPQPEIVLESEYAFRNPITCLHWKGGNCGSIRGNGQDWLKTQCPYGQASDFLWVRENYWTGLQTPAMPVYITYDTGHVEEQYVPADFKPQRIGRHPSIHLPRWASRITLEITEVRVERVQEITEEDAKAEGSPSFWLTSKDGKPFDTVIPSLWFESLWDSLNAKRGYGWSMNPWVWVIAFRKL